MTRSIQLRGARTRNLKNVDLDLPIGKVTVLTGVSGSGKSSLAMDTLHAEARRRFVQALGGASGAPAPDVDLISGLPPTLAVPARPALPAHQRLGEIVGCIELLAVLFARRGEVWAPGATAPLAVATADQVTDELLALPPGTRLTIRAPLVRASTADWLGLLAELRLQGFSRVQLDGRMLHLDDARVTQPDSPHDLDLVVDRLKTRPDRRDRIGEAVRTAMGAGSGRLLAEVVEPGSPARLDSWADHPWDPTTDKAWPALRPERFDRRRRAGACTICSGHGHIDGTPCATCDGAGTGELGRAVRLDGTTFDHLLGQPARDIQRWLRGLSLPSELDGVRAQLDTRLSALVELRLGHLPLDRHAADLARGERSRSVLAARTAHQLTDLVFVLDEPTSHLGPPGVDAVLRCLGRLRDRGLTVIVVDHNPRVLGVADHAVEFGPGAGLRGGEVLYAGPPGRLAETDTPTGRVLSDANPAPDRVHHATTGAVIRLSGATGRNLADADIAVPVGAVTVVTGPSGSGKRSLVEDTLGAALAHRLDQSGPTPLPFKSLDIPQGSVLRVVQLNRTSHGRAPRSCVATACGTWGPIRSLLSQTREARVRGFRSEHFSFNTPAGRCPACEGMGELVDKAGPFSTAARTCPECQGERLGRATRPVRWRGHTAGALLKLDVDAALGLFGEHRRVRRPLRALAMVGLGHLPLGRPTGSLSGGEYQRLQLARELARAGDPSQLTPNALAGTVLVLDMPSAGLHHLDAVRVADGITQMASAGATVVCADVHPAMLHAADRIVCLGPGAGPDGGTVLSTTDVE